jgi:regulator of nucleoside diphosphate kinase
MRSAPIQITDRDARRLRQLILELELARSTHPREVSRLRRELEHASIVPEREADADLVTMNTRLVVRDLERDRELSFTLAFPDEADDARERISVLAPIGTAVLGCRRGSIVEWEVPAGLRRFRIERVVGPPGNG